MPSNREIAAEMHSAVDSRFDELSKLDVAAIQALPALREQKISADGKSKLWEYHDVLDSGEHKVVLQAIRPIWFGLINSVFAVGFVLQADGQKRPLTDKERWEFE